MSTPNRIDPVPREELTKEPMPFVWRDWFNQLHRVVAINAATTSSTTSSIDVTQMRAFARREPTGFPVMAIYNPDSQGILAGQIFGS